MVKRSLSAQKRLDLIHGPVKLDTKTIELATAATFLRSCVAQALSRGDGPRYSSLDSAYYRDLIDFFDTIY